MPRFGPKSTSDGEKTVRRWHKVRKRKSDGVSSKFAAGRFALYFVVPALFLSPVLMFAMFFLSTDTNDVTITTFTLPICAAMLVSVIGYSLERFITGSRRCGPWGPTAVFLSYLLILVRLFVELLPALPEARQFLEHHDRLRRFAHFEGNATGNASISPAASVAQEYETKAKLRGTAQASVTNGRISVVLPCASEGTYAIKTVWSFCNRTPSSVLEEIIVVDDGGPVSGGRGLEEELMGQISPTCKVRVLRHETTLGLMVAKQTGGDAATGQYIGFFDCHVAPNDIWYKELTGLLESSPRRLVVPTITDLDIDTWDEKKESAVNSKCYIGWDADFMWFEDESDFIPVISGGLVALSREWWRESGGFDKQMRGWGGENVDQSLRTWLCGGDVVRARTSRVAHMWRVPNDPRTTAHYRHAQSKDGNIVRVAAAWFDEFSVKFHEGELQSKTIDVSETTERKRQLNCKPFAFFLHRFRHIYDDGGILPTQVFSFRSKSHNGCIHRSASAWTVGSCRKAAKFHFANRQKHTGKCCSGIRQWNTMECFDRLDPRGPLPYYCDVTGGNENQQYTFDKDAGLIKHVSGKCVSTTGSALSATDCREAVKWEVIEEFIPEETKLYTAAVQKYGFADDAPAN